MVWHLALISPFFAAGAKRCYKSLVCMVHNIGSIAPFTGTFLVILLLTSFASQDINAKPTDGKVSTTWNSGTFYGWESGTEVTKRLIFKVILQRNMSLSGKFDFGYTGDGVFAPEANSSGVLSYTGIVVVKKDGTEIDRFKVTITANVAQIVPTSNDPREVNGTWNGYATTEPELPPTTLSLLSTTLMTGLCSIRGLVLRWRRRRV